MKFAEKVFVFFLLIGIVSRYFKSDFGGIALAMGIVGLMFIYLVFGFALYNGGISLKKSDKQSKAITYTQFILGAVAGVFNITMLIGMIFKLQYWPYAASILWTGFVLSAGLAAATYYLYRSSTSVLAKNIALRTAGLLLLCVLLPILMRL